MLVVICSENIVDKRRLQVKFFVYCFDCFVVVDPMLKIKDSCRDNPLTAPASFQSLCVSQCCVF